MKAGGPSLAGRGTDIRKLNGQVYTPLPVARQMLDMVSWPLGHEDGVLLDPACGDGVFLEAAIHKVLGLSISAAKKKEIIGDRLRGWDLDPSAVSACRERLRSVVGEMGAGAKLPSLEVRNALVPSSETFACVIGNPPYLEAKRMPDDLKALVRRFRPLAAKGAFDLYTAFIELACGLTEPDGDICLLIPNRFLVVSYAEELRRRLLATRHVRVTDLSEQKIFDAAVYPIILEARPKATSKGHGSASYTVLPTVTSRKGVALRSRVLLDRLGGIMPVAPTHEGGRRLLKRVLTEKYLSPLSRHLLIRWTVSFHKAGLRDRYVYSEPAHDMKRPRRFLGGGRFQGNREISAYRISWNGSWIDYDTERAKNEGNPLPPLELFEKPKLVICQNARRARCAIDENGYVLKDTFLAGILEREKDGLLEWLCLVLNSDVVHYVYEHLYGGTRKGGGYLHFLSRYLSPLPVPPMPDASKVLPIHEILADSSKHEPANERDANASRGTGLTFARSVRPSFQEARQAAEKLVREAYGVTAFERRALESYSFPSPHSQRSRRPGRSITSARGNTESLSSSS